MTVAFRTCRSQSDRSTLSPRPGRRAAALQHFGLGGAEAELEHGGRAEE
jgi:hypothetical protein